MFYKLDEQYFFSYDFASFALTLTNVEKNQLLSSCFETFDDFQKDLYLRNSSIKELEIILDKGFTTNSKYYVFNAWVNEEIGGNSYWINAYKDLIDDKNSFPKDIDSLNSIYEKYVRPRNIAFKKKNVKRFHKFRDTPLLENDSFDNLINNLSNGSYKKYLAFLKDVPPKEEDIVSSINVALDVLRDENLDIYVKAGIFLFKYLLTMPYYGILNNLFIGLYILTLYFYNNNHEILALNLWQILGKEDNIELLLIRFYETMNPINHGDLSHFVYPFVEILKDGTLRLTQELKALESKEKELNNLFKGKLSKSDKILYSLLVSSSTYTKFGSPIQELQEKSNISIPTINRFLKKMKDSKHLLKTRIGKKDFYKIG